MKNLKNYLRSKLKSYIYSIEFLHELSVGAKIVKKKWLMNKLERKAKKLGIDFTGPLDLEKPDIERYKVCHIIGSGWSVEKSRDLIFAEDAYVIGFNFACLADIPFNLYFVEFGGYECQDIAYAQKRALDKFNINPENNTKVIFKNLWQSRNDLEFALKLYGDQVDYARDVPIT